MTVQHALLSREEFHQIVLARSSGRCVLCGDLAVDAHHILERKLFSDHSIVGGYSLSNGAAVCAACHWDCETTKVTVEQVRSAAAIQEPLLPIGFLPTAIYDKWGNRVWPSGMRTAGQLDVDIGMRRALASAGLLGFLMPSEYTEENASGETP